MAVVAMCSKCSCVKEQASQKIIFYFAVTCDPCHEKLCTGECISGIKEIMAESFLSSIDDLLS